MAHEFQNGEHTEEWPAQDRPGSSDGAENDENTATDAGKQAGELTVERHTADENMADEGMADERRADELTTDEPIGDEQTADELTTDELTTDEQTAEQTADEPIGDDLLLPQADSQPGLYDNRVPSAQSMFAADDSDAPVNLDDDSDVTGEDRETIELRNAGARDIDATTVSITQGGARDVDATTVTINQGGAARIRADELYVSQGGVGLARTDRLTLRDGGTAFAVFADKANLDPESSVFLLVAGSTTGNVRPVVDWRTAAAFGAGFALVLGLLRRGRR